MRRWILRLLALGLTLVLARQLWLFGHVLHYARHPPGETAFMQWRLDEMRARSPKAELRHRWVPYERVSIHLKRALVAAEDARFLDHDGFDWDAIQDALEENLKRGRVVRGGSTISQQLAKNLFLSPARTPWRKAQEAVLTVMIEAVMDKRRILELYLNVIEWGDGVFGAEAAARHYFGVSAAALSPEQAARLAAKVPHPRYYDRHRDSKRLARRTEVILARMPRAAIPK